MNTDLAAAVRVTGLILLVVGTSGQQFSRNLKSTQGMVLNLVFLGFGLTFLSLGIFGLSNPVRVEVLIYLPVLLIGVAFATYFIAQIARLTGKQKMAESGQSTEKTE